MAERLVEKVCPVILRGATGAREVLVFRHPLAGIQLVKGTREAGETAVAGALRELAEESGIVEGVLGTFVCSSSGIAAGQLWNFVRVQCPNLPERWSFFAQDDGGQELDFFWWCLCAEPDRDWHPDFVRALDVVRQIDAAPMPDAAMVMADYAQRINTHRFADVAPLIDADAVFWFSDGSHSGIAAIQAAFEATWAALADELYWIESLRWIAVGDAAASCIYRFHWQAMIDGERQSGSGRGTTVLAKKSGGWQIVHEHLSPAR